MTTQSGNYDPSTASGEAGLHGEQGGTPPTGHFAEAVLMLWEQRLWIAGAILLGTLLAAAVSLLLPSEYASTTRIMPPDQQGSVGLALLAGGADDRLSAMLSDAIGLKSTGAIFIGIMRSRTVEDGLIERFELLDVYDTRLLANARKRLSRNADIQEDRKSGIITVTVTDRSPQRAQALAAGYVQELNTLTAQLTTSAAHRERVFIEERLAKVRVELDEAANALSAFASEHATIDPREQGKAMLEAMANLQGELLAAQAQLSGLEQIYTSNNVRVRSLRARVGELEKQLARLQGSQPRASAGGASATATDIPSIRELPSLSVTYYDLYRQLRVQEAVFEILTKQHELAKIQEAKEIPTVRVLDEADLPERRSRPARTKLSLMGGALAGLFAVGFLLISSRWRNIEPDHPTKVVGLHLQEGISQDLKNVWRRLKRKPRQSSP